MWSPVISSSELVFWGYITRFFYHESDYRRNSTIQHRGCCGNSTYNDNPKGIGASVSSMSITLTIIAFNNGRPHFDAFVLLVLNIMSRWEFNGTGPMWLNIWGKSGLVEIWWHVRSDEFVLYIVLSQSVFEIRLSCFFPHLSSIGSLVQSVSW